MVGQSGGDDAELWLLWSHVLGLSLEMVLLMMLMWRQGFLKRPRWDVELGGPF